MGKRVIIGVTGGLATGKTTVADMFKGKGAVKIDADKIAHELLKKNSEIIKKLSSLFGRVIFTGNRIDRRKLAKEVFCSREKLKELSRVLHPLIIERIKNKVKRASRPAIVIDAPLLIEAGLEDFVDIVVVVAAKYGTQLERAKKRGLSAAEAKRIIASQMPLAKKKKAADYIIDSEKNIKTVKKGVNRIWQKV